MPVGLTLEYAVGNETGVAAVERLAFALERAGDNLSDWGRWLYPELIPALEEAMRQQFAAQGKGPAAGAWAQLSEAYAAWKAGHFPGQPILRATDTLYEALTSSSSPHALRDYSAEDFNFGTQYVDYASFHQLGTQRMVARPPVDFGPDVEKALVRAAATALRKMVRNAGVEGAPSAEEAA